MSRFPEIMKAGGDDDHESTEVRVQLQGSAMVLQNQMLVISSHFTMFVLHQFKVWGVTDRNFPAQCTE